MTMTAGGSDTGAVASWRLWVVPLAAGIFLDILNVFLLFLRLFGSSR